MLLEGSQAKVIPAIELPLDSPGLSYPLSQRRAQDPQRLNTQLQPAIALSPRDRLFNITALNHALTEVNNGTL
ncbi:MAG TPA: hypothetical protein V6C63_13410 [Allocoleopsis sp.]